MADEKKESKIQGKYHSLFQEEIDEIKEEKTINGEKLFLIQPKHTKFRLFITSFADDEKGLHEIFNVLWNAKENDKLEMRINSGGGSIKEGQQIIHIMKNQFHGKTTTILDASAYSMGALTFCAGNERIVTEYSDLMFHDYSSCNWGKGQELESYIEHNKKHIRDFFKDIIVNQGFLSTKEFEEMLIGKDFWMDTKELCKRGIATHVLKNGKKIKAKKYLKSLRKKNHDKKK